MRRLLCGGLAVALSALACLVVLTACPPPPTSGGLVTVHYVETMTMRNWLECRTGLGFSGPSSFAAYEITEIDNNQPHAADFTLHLPFIYASIDPSAAHDQDVPGAKNVPSNWFHNCNTVATLPPGSDLTVKAGAVLKLPAGTETFVIGLSPDVETGPDVTGLDYNFTKVPGLHILMENDTGHNAPFCDTGSNSSKNENVWSCS